MSRAKNIKTPGDAAPVEAVVATGTAAPEVAGLPNAVDVDARWLKGPVLTRQGWVTPDEGWQKANAAEFAAGPKG